MALNTQFEKNMFSAVLSLLLCSCIICYSKRATNVYASSGSRESKSIYNVSQKDGYDAKVVTVGNKPNKGKKKAYCYHKNDKKII